ncbi:MAG: lactonase family protein [Kiritimatiellae bacterium]|nr:lactonase family protein [Kiritimatiellia bacterium]
MKYITYVGSYTDATRREGIHIFESDSETGDFRLLGVVDDVENPTYMALSRGRTRLYAVVGRQSFGPAGRQGGLAAFAVRGERLELINAIPTGWTVPCHVALDPSERTLVYAEYSCGTAGYANLAPDGSIDPAFAGAPGAINPRFQVQHAGDGPNKLRQDKAHAHCSIVTPDGRFQLVVDLSLDQVKAYDFANRAQGMKEVPYASIDTRSLAPGAGPRHIVFHPNGKLAFVIFELGNLVASFRYTGRGFRHVATCPLLEGEAMKACKAAAIKISEDGTQLFCSNRDTSRSGYDSITVFNIDPGTGKMEFLNNAKVGGAYPRDFEFMPGGKFCLVGLKEDWRVASFAYDRANGTFSQVAQMEGVYRPLYFKFNVP